MRARGARPPHDFDRAELLPVCRLIGDRSTPGRQPETQGLRRRHRSGAARRRRRSSAASRRSSASVPGRVATVSIGPATDLSIWLVSESPDLTIDCCSYMAEFGGMKIVALSAVLVLACVCAGVAQAAPTRSEFIRKGRRGVRANPTRACANHCSSPASKAPPAESTIGRCRSFVGRPDPNPETVRRSLQSAWNSCR